MAAAFQAVRGVFAPLALIRSRVNSEARIVG